LKIKKKFRSDIDGPPAISRLQNGVGRFSNEMSIRNRIKETRKGIFLKNDMSVRMRDITVSMSEIGQLDQLISTIPPVICSYLGND